MKKRTYEAMNRLTPTEYKEAGKLDICVVLDNVRSQHNIGSLFRSCDAFRVGSLYLCGITATPPHREIHKTALGAEDSVSWKYYPDTREAMDELKSQGYRLVAIEQAEGSVFLQDFRVSADDKLAIIFGNEIDGVSDEIMEIVDASIEIPQFGTKHSLNIAVSAGIVLWQLFGKKRGFTALST